MPFDAISSTGYLYGRSDKRSGLIYLRITFRQNNAFVIIYEHILNLKILPNIFRINLPDELAEISCYSELVG